MATKAETKKQIDEDNELVPVYLFKDSDKYKDDVFVAVNGERAQVQRGKTILIKRKFARVLDDSAYQDTQAAALQDELSNQFAADAKQRNI